MESRTARLSGRDGGQAKGTRMTIAHEEAVIDSAAVDAIFAEARTANAFTGEVTEQQARAIYELTKFGPTAFNSQPLRVTYVRSEEARAKLVDALSSGNRAKTASAPLVAVLSYDTSWQEQWENFLPGYNAPKAMYDASPDLATSTGNNNAHLQAGYFILAVRSLGFAAGPRTGADFNAIDAAFFPAGDQKSFLVVNIGQPAAGAWGEAKPKFAYEDVVRTV
jgi:3-hydroxypropanoate dehydrogenase